MRCMHGPHFFQVFDDGIISANALQAYCHQFVYWYREGVLGVSTLSFPS